MLRILERAFRLPGKPQLPRPGGILRPGRAALDGIGDKKRSHARRASQFGGSACAESFSKTCSGCSKNTLMLKFVWEEAPRYGKAKDWRVCESGTFYSSICFR